MSQSRHCTTEKCVCDDYTGARKRMQICALDFILTESDSAFRHFHCIIPYIPGAVNRSCMPSRMEICCSSSAYCRYFCL